MTTNRNPIMVADDIRNKMEEQKKSLKFPEAEQLIMTYGREESVYPELTIAALGSPNAGGAYTEYAIQTLTTDTSDPKLERALTQLAHFKFQSGALPGPINGIIDEALLTILIHRTKCFLNGPYADAHTALSLRHLEDALHRREMRTKERAQRGVLGKYKA